MFRPSTAILVIGVILSLAFAPLFSQECDSQIQASKQAFGQTARQSDGSRLQEPACHQNQGNNQTKAKERGVEKKATLLVESIPSLYTIDKSRDCGHCGPDCACPHSSFVNNPQLAAPRTLNLEAPLFLKHALSCSFDFNSQTFADIFHPPRV